MTNMSTCHEPDQAAAINDQLLLDMTLSTAAGRASAGSGRADS
ncbi:hypothetical protein [Nocardia cyriacigeorgica]|nr:hypothetical protein [Nocardia cyriacigeorgica]